MEQEGANMKRRDILVLVEWCKNKFGESKFQKTFPKIVVNNKKGPYCGVYFPTENEIHIFPAQNKTFIYLCDTIIQEYTHYLQKMDMYDVLVKEIDDKVKQLFEYVGTGKADTFEEYKRLCGEIRGLLVARGYTLDLKQRMEHSDE